MSNLLKRILLAAGGIPVLIILIFVLTQYSHLLLNILIVLLSAIGGLEARNLFIKRKTDLNPVKTAFIAAVFPIFSIFVVLGLLPQAYIVPLIVLSVSIMFIREALMRQEKLIESVLDRLPAYCFLLFFPGFFISFLILINLMEHSSLLIIIFLTLVFSNDTFAYIFGMLLGGNNRGMFPVSPKKSLAGFIGGIASSGIAAYIFFIFFPHIFNDNLFLAVLTGISIGFTSVIGDLLESALKRSAGEKDSGTLMGGRGGVLDVIDSILFSAPFYYYIMVLFQK